MLEERFRFMYLGKEGTELKQISFSRKKFRIFLGVASFALLVVSALIINLFTNLFHDVQITLLKKDREHLQKELLTIKERVSTISDQLSSVEKMGDDLRNATGLSAINQDVRQVGVGGPMYYSALDFGYYPDEVGRTAQEIKVDLEKFERALKLEVNSLNQIDAAIEYRNEWVSHFPSINPILGGRVSPDFGIRIDPFVGKLAPHQGIDILEPIGTKVLAAADGVVETAKTDYSPNSYGCHVVINHIYGYETRYAHLSKIMVRVGQKVKKWDVIGEVGKTGRATGPHLHYEVIESDKKMNPVDFILNNGNNND